MSKRFAFCALLFSLSSIATANIPLGSTAKTVSLQDKLGGKVTGGAWSSQTDLTTNKVNLVFYIDPDNRTMNDDLAERLKAEKFPRDQYSSTVVINMAATWLPNDFLDALLKRKQKQYPDTMYVKDFEKVLVKEWGLPDDSYTVMAFDKQGKLWYSRDGKFTADQIEEVVTGIKGRLN